MLLSVVLLGACAGRVETTVRKQAASDFGCSVEQIKVGDMHDPDPFKRAPVHRAHGCDKTHAYEASCNLFVCKARTAASLGMSKPLDDPEDVLYTVEDAKRRREAAKPRRFTVKVFSLCKEANVDIRVGIRPDVVPKGGLKELDHSAEGEVIYIHDRSVEGNRGDEIALSESQPIVYIDETCKKFKKEG